jgi:clan AA aspartic protease (TIGR02281 family)
MRIHPAAILGLALFLTFLDPGAACAALRDDVGPVRILKNYGIERQRGSASAWSLVGEATVLKKYRYAKGLAEQLAAAHQQQQFNMDDQNPRAMIDYYQGQIDMRDARIAEIDKLLPQFVGAGGNLIVIHNILVQERNTLGGEQSRLQTMINNVLRQGNMNQNQKEQFNREVALMRESFVNAVEDLHDSVSDIQEKYDELGKKTEIKKALADLTASSRSSQKLGPSKELRIAIKWLERTRGSVQSETFTLRREGGVDHIEAMLNGKGPVSMVFDTGAGPTTIPSRLASDLGLKATGRTVPCKVADGSQVMAKLMVIPSVKVGRLSVRNVTCVVMPTDKGDTPPLLGQSFLQHFDYKYTQKTGRLVLTKVEPDKPIPGAGAKPHGKTGVGTTPKKAGKASTGPSGGGR